MAYPLAEAFWMSNARANWPIVASRSPGVATTTPPRCSATTAVQARAPATATTSPPYIARSH